MNELPPGDGTVTIKTYLYVTALLYISVRLLNYLHTARQLPLLMHSDRSSVAIAYAQ